MSKVIDQQVEDFKRQLLANHLAQCTEAQQALFRRCYPNGVPGDRLVNAIDLCRRTIKKNLADLSQLEARPQ